MRTVRTFFSIGVILLMLGLILPSVSYAADSDEIKISEWQMHWETEHLSLSDIMVKEDGWWKTVSSNDGVPVKPDGVAGVWYRISIPPTQWEQAGLLLPVVYALDVKVYADDSRTLFNFSRGYTNEVNQILIPLQSKPQGETIFIHLESPSDRLGIKDAGIVKEYQSLLPVYVEKGLADILMGSAFLFMALVMLVCGLLLRSIYIPSWLSLGVVILSIGVLMLTYSPFTYTFFSEIGKAATIGFDMALLILFPALCFYFEKIMELKKRSFVSIFRCCLIWYSLFCFALLFIYLAVGASFFNIYYFFSVTIYGFIIIAEFVILMCYSIRYALKGNTDAMLFTSGFAIFAFVSIGELVWFFIQSTEYELWLWKWGVLGFVLSLIIILGRTIALNHERVIRYSKDLEMYNNELQHAEKMEMISELAASVAHEVRNPLQVTRGFLQIIASKADPKERDYLDLAVNELDRASSIITDFLTFAKPELQDLKVLKIAEEMKHIEGILMPLANMSGATINVDVPSSLAIRGNSSKFKQAFINLIKNSIEALDDAGEIRIWGYEQENRVYIHIQDNGIGMTEQELKRLGEPYYTNKIKGTGLGLIVTYRIVEVMCGRLHFNSEKGVGTEAVIDFPQATE
ncbi:ATP-binding protein [Paenibacillus marinisediminis]